MTPPLIELAGDAGAPVLHLAPANGFPPLSYLPMLRRLSAFRCLCLPPRALWGDHRPPADYRDWGADADDLLAGLAAYDLQDVLAIGHSLGGVVSMLALLKAPARFKALIMLDPPILPPAMLAEVSRAWDTGIIDRMPLVQSARRRRRPSPAAKTPLSASVRSRSSPIGPPSRSGIMSSMACESARMALASNWSGALIGRRIIFQRSISGFGKPCPSCANRRPLLILRGGESDTLTADVFARVQALAPALDSIELAGQGHLFPLASPDETARVIMDWLQCKGL